MARPRKPWFRKHHNDWCVTIDGSQVPLAKGFENKAYAVKEFHRLMSVRDEPEESAPQSTLLSLFGRFLGWIKKHKAPATYQQLRHFLKSFLAHKRVKSLRPTQVTVEMVEGWLEAHPKWTTSRRHGIRSLLHAFNWCVKRKLLAKNPIAGIEVPARTRITSYLTKEQRKTVYAAGRGKPFKNLLTALEQTGCRPGEVSAVTAADVDLQAGVWTLKQHKTGKKTGKPRTVYLTDAMVALTRELMATNPTGTLFLNQDKKPWTRQAIRCRFRNLRKKFPAFGHFTAYSFRRAFVTDALERGVDVAQVAELVGHTSTDMVMRFYSQLQERVQHMREMAQKAAG
jgi:integrase